MGQLKMGATACLGLTLATLGTGKLIYLAQANAPAVQLSYFHLASASTRPRVAAQPYLSHAPLRLAQADARPTPRFNIKVGEILLQGRIHAIDTRQQLFTLEATSFKLPDGKSSALSPAKIKTIRLNATTILQARDSNARKVTLTALAAAAQPVFALVTGADLGSGKPLPARLIEVWDRTEAGRYRFGKQASSTTPDTPPTTTLAPDHSASPASSGSVAPLPATTRPQEPEPHATRPVINATTAAGDNTPHGFNGDFEQLTPTGQPVGWNLDPRHMSILDEIGNHFLRITNDNPQADILALGQCPLDPSWKMVKVQTRMRVKALNSGAGRWNVAQLGLQTLDGKGQPTTYNLIASPKLQGDLDWTTLEVLMPLPAGTTRLQFTPGLTHTTGSVDFDDIVVSGNPPLSTIPLQTEFPAGTFEELDATGYPVGWRIENYKKVQVVSEDGNHFLRLTNDDAEDTVVADGYFKLEPRWKAMALSARLRGQQIKIGSLAWKNARLGFAFVDAWGQQLGPRFQSLDLNADSDWKTMSLKWAVPPGALYLKMEAILQKCTGTLDVDDIAAQPLGSATSDDGPNLTAAPLPLKNAAGNLLAQGTFEQADEQGQPTGWVLSDPAHIRLLEEDGNHFLRFLSAKPDTALSATCRITLDPLWQKLIVRARLRGQGLRLGVNREAQPQVGVEFMDAGGKLIGRWQEVPAIRQDNDWVASETGVYIPYGAVAALIKPEMVNCAGIVDFDDVQIIGQQLTPAPFLATRALSARLNEPITTFEALAANGLPVGWSTETPDQVKVVAENGNHFLRVVNQDPQGTAAAGCYCRLDPTWKVIFLRVKMRAQNLKRGAQPWETARLGTAFMDAAGERIGGYPAPAQMNHDSDWITVTQQLDIPTGATYLKLDAQLLHSTGIADFDDIVLAGPQP